MKSHIPALTSIRFIFAFQILVLHFVLYTAAAPELPFLVKNITMAGYVGVSFFFVLSGFILTCRYLDLNAGKFNFSRFYLARFARVYPVYVTSILYILPFLLIFEFPPAIKPPTLQGEFTSLALQVIFMQSWNPVYALNWNFPAWSLSAEAFFYLLFPFFAIAVSRLGTGWLLLIMLGSYFVSMLIAAIPYIYNISDLGFIMADEIAKTGSDFYTLFFRLNPFLRIPEFFAGVAAGMIFLKHPQHIKRHAGLFAFTALAGISAALALSSQIPFMFMHNGLLVPFEIMLLWSLTHEKSSAILGAPFLVLLGKASYALYLIHMPVFYLTMLLLYPFMPHWVAFCGFSVLAISLSLLVHRKTEVPWQNYIMAKFGKRLL